MHQMNRTCAAAGRRTVVVLLAALLSLASASAASASPLDGAGSNPTDDWQSDEHTLQQYGSVTVGNYVAVWQLVLRADNALYPACGKIDGYFGGGTKQATQTWQAGKGLPADGIVGPNTWNQADNRLIRPLGNSDEQVNYRGSAITPVFSKPFSAGVSNYFLEQWNVGDGVNRFSSTDHPINDMKKC